MATHKGLMTLFGKLGFDRRQRYELIYAWTGGRTKSSTGLLPIEIDELYTMLQNDFKFSSNTDAHIEILCKKKRSIVLSIATRTGIHDPNDWNRFNRFMKNSSILKKQLNQYEIDELDKLIKQFRALEDNYGRSAKKAGTKAWSHKHGLPRISHN
ncbi:hypothetical protein [Flagellimonas onchidii]|uniref:hypothetical protein n=1 Tax=Flagellimonas onchidii TaxID=2562684 RepID=UPI0010A67D31|nr:hypothetical protein [Allomuricauda onchidii]